MKRYEGLFILKPNLGEDEFQVLTTSVTDVITKNGGRIENKEDMGLRQLAYEIKKDKQGHYLLINFSAEGKTISVMEKAYRLNESILRALIFNYEGK